MQQFKGCHKFEHALKAYMYSTSTGAGITLPGSEESPDQTPEVLYSTTPTGQTFLTKAYVQSAGVTCREKPGNGRQSTSEGLMQPVSVPDGTEYLLKLDYLTSK